MSAAVVATMVVKTVVVHGVCLCMLCLCFSDIIHFWRRLFQKMEKIFHGQQKLYWCTHTVISKKGSNRSRYIIIIMAAVISGKMKSSWAFVLCWFYCDDYGQKGLLSSIIFLVGPIHSPFPCSALPYHPRFPWQARLTWLFFSWCRRRRRRRREIVSKRRMTDNTKKCGWQRDPDIIWLKTLSLLPSLFRHVFIWRKSIRKERWECEYTYVSDINTA